MDEQADDKTTGKCPFTGGAREYTSRDWWPNQLNRLRHRRSGRDVDDGRAQVLGLARHDSTLLLFPVVARAETALEPDRHLDLTPWHLLTVVISAIYPDEPFPLPLNQLLYDLAIAARIAIPIR
jgi:hypothetical protein